jgi:Rhodopirellula transposase DDE domain
MNRMPQEFLYQIQISDRVPCGEVRTTDLGFCVPKLILASHRLRKYGRVRSLNPEHRSDLRQSPVISVDTKKKELIGNFKNQGQEWQPKRQPIQVNMHDFEDALCHQT